MYMVTIHPWWPVFVRSSISRHFVHETPFYNPPNPYKREIPTYGVYHRNDHCRSHNLLQCAERALCILWRSNVAFEVAPFRSRGKKGEREKELGARLVLALLVYKASREIVGQNWPVNFDFCVDIPRGHWHVKSTLLEIVEMWCIDGSLWIYDKWR